MRQQRFGSNGFNPHRHIEVCAMVFVLALLFRVSPAIAGGCDTEFLPVYPDSSHSFTKASCSTSADAQQACNSWIQALPGYSSDTCLHVPGDVESWYAGNLCLPKAPVGTCPSGKFTFGAFWVLRYYASSHPLALAQCGNCVSDPINSASGEIYTEETDIAPLNSGLSFKRYFNSADGGDHNSGPGWRFSYTRSVVPRYSEIIYKPYVQNSPENSSIYNDAASACTSGFAQLKAKVSTWANATASYSTGVCVLSRNGLVIGTLPVFAFQAQSSSGQVSNVVNAISGPVLLGYDVIRDDGQLVRFVVSGGTAVAPPSIVFQLQQTANGFTLRDDSDGVEAYDTNGKLQSITKRTGVVQTMSYDGLGRLETVTDTFGRSLTLAYDAQGRLLSVRSD